MAENGTERSIWKGAIAGAVGGLAASFVMNQFQSVWQSVAGDSKKSGGSQNGGNGRSNGKESEESEGATVMAAEAISETLLGRELTKEEKTYAGPGMHYAFGASMGALYGAAAEVVPFVSKGVGLPFGSAVWLIADEVVVPALGLSEPPTEHPLSTHGYALASHLVYGMTSDVVRKTVRKALG